MFGPIPVTLPTAGNCLLLDLKRYEDALDALVSAWVGVEYIEQRAVAFGDARAAIWCPK